MSKPKQPKRSGKRAVTVAKGGRPRLPGVVREPNGKPSRRVIHVGERREMDAKEAKSVGIEARMRMTGLSADLAGLNHAGMPNAGTVHGVMRLRGIEAEVAAERRGQAAELAAGMLSADDWFAAEWWLGARIAYLRAIDAPGRKTTERGEGVAADPEAMAEWCRATIERWAEVNRCLTEAGLVSRRPISAALDVILVRNQPMPHMEGDLRLCLAAIHTRFLGGSAKGR